MKRSFKFIVLLFVVSLFMFVTATTVNAEETQEEPVEPEYVEEVFTYYEGERVYTYIIFNEKQARCIITMGEDDTTEFLMTYTYENEILKFYMLGEELGSFTIGENNVLAYYEEPVVDEPVVETPEEPVEEEVSFREMIRNFIDEWLIAILATFGGAGGTAVVMLIGKKILQKILDSLNKTAEANAESNKVLEQAKSVVSAGMEVLNGEIAEFKEQTQEMIETKLLNATEIIERGLVEVTRKIEEFDAKYKASAEETSNEIIRCINEIDFLKTEDSKFKELVALLVSSNPQLASSGYATKILELLNEGSVKDE